jgi:hypothetical protein
MAHSIFDLRYAAAFVTRMTSSRRRPGRPVGALLLAGLWLLLLTVTVPAWADLMLYPTRIVFEKNQRSAQLELINNGTETTTYRINIVNRRMSETGEFSAIDSPLTGELFADQMLQYSPRQVVLEPGVSQTIRLSLRKPADLPAGEYRSHLQLERIADAKGDTAIASLGQAAPKDISIRLTALVGATIPVIVRQGETSAQLTLTDIELLAPAPGQPASLAVVLHRSGNRSVYGDLGATFTPRGGTAQGLGKVSGVAVYAPNPLRRVRLQLAPPAGLVLTNGTLLVTFREREDAGDKLLAQASLELP